MLITIICTFKLANEPEPEFFLLDPNLIWRITTFQVVALPDFQTNMFLEEKKKEITISFCFVCQLHRSQ